MHIIMHIQKRGTIMQIITNYNTLYFYEGLMAVINGFNNGVPMSIKQDFINRSIDISEKQLNNILFDSEQLIQKIMQNVNIEDETTKFLFKHRDNCEPYATAFLNYRHVKGTTKDDKAFAIFNMLLFVVDEDPDNMKEFFTWVDEYECDALKKYELVKLYSKFDDYNIYVTDIVTKAEKIIKEFIPSKIQYINENIDKITTYLKKDNFSFIPVKLGNESVINIYPSMVMLNALTIQKFTKNEDTSIIAGVAILELIELEQTYASRECRNMDKFLKALADPTKYSVLKLLRDKSYYNNQIANEIGLTGATISHHMNALVQLELVFVEQQGAKTYYGFNKNMFEKYINELRKQMLK